MRFSLAIPPASALRRGRQRTFTIPAGAELHRIHPSRYESAQFNDTASGNARFSPIRGAGGAIIPTIYAAQSFECAACEIILRCPDAPPPSPATLTIVSPGDFAAYSHSVVRLTADVELLDLTAAGQRRIGVDQNALLAGPRSSYPATRAWAEAIHAHMPTAQGLHYSSFQYGPEFALLLFGDRVPDGTVQPMSKRAIRDPACHREIDALAHGLWIDYADI
jgi:hypothetical protein